MTWPLELVLLLAVFAAGYIAACTVWHRHELYEEDRRLRRLARRDAHRAEYPHR